MGNCLRIQQQILRFTTIDDKEIEYRSPLSAHEVSSDVVHHRPAVSSDTKYKQLNVRKKVRFSEPEVEESGESTGLQVKVVISKQKLKEMIARGVVSIEGMVSEIVQNQQNQQNGDYYECCNKNGVWKPALNSIPEVDC